MRIYSLSSFRFVSFRFVSFRFVSFRFVSFRFVSFRLNFMQENTIVNPHFELHVWVILLYAKILSSDIKLTEPVNGRTETNPLISGCYTLKLPIVKKTAVH